MRPCRCASDRVCSGAQAPASGSHPRKRGPCSPVRGRVRTVLAETPRAHQSARRGLSESVRFFRAGEFRSRLSFRITQGIPKERFSGAAFFGLTFLAVLRKRSFSADSPGFSQVMSELKVGSCRATPGLSPQASPFVNQNCALLGVLGNGIRSRTFPMPVMYNSSRSKPKPNPE